MEFRKLLAALLVTAGLAIVAGCGSSSDDHGDHGGGDEMTPKETDIAFATGMIPHHLAAVEMAEIALEEAERPEIRRLSREIIRTQRDEIRELEAAYEEITGVESTSAEHAKAGMTHDAMGMTAKEMGMDMDPAELRGAEPFDLAFIEMMIPHHEGAVRMAEMHLEDGEDPGLKDLSERVIEAQSKEIDQMEAWSSQWQGEAQTG